MHLFSNHLLINKDYKLDGSINTEDFVMSYQFIKKSDSTYFDMVKQYQAHLVETYLLEKITQRKITSAQVDCLRKSALPGFHIKVLNHLRPLRESETLEFHTKLRY